MKNIVKTEDLKEIVFPCETNASLIKTTSFHLNINIVSTNLFQQKKNILILIEILFKPL